MGRVRVLPEVLAHQIAAGEIVERPASVVKELMENSLDADCSRLHVEVREGGRSLIRVVDDGIGMSRQDCELAFEHHATSKIREADDLTRIATLGFRGEALPSIASVSRIRLKTVARDEAQRGDAPGAEIEYRGGRRSSLREIAWAEGTEVTVEDLFFNVPARRSFLKTASTELSHISRQVTVYALAHPAIEFRLLHQGRELVDAPAVDSLQERAFQLFGESFVANLVPLEYELEGVRVGGYTSLPHEQRSNAGSLYLYVNGRMVRDRVLMHAVRLAYRDLIPSSCYPVSLLFVRIDPEQIDVNVHPMKTEIRFRNSQAAHRAICHAIEEALLVHRKNLSSLARDVSLRPDSAGVVQSMEAYLHRYSGATPASFGRRAFSLSSQPLQGRFALAPSASADPSRPDPHADQIPVTDYIPETPVVLGQFVESFIVAVDREGVLVVDQHVAHERILYDQALRQMAGKERVAVQRLLTPVTLDLAPQQRAVSDFLLEQLNANGFEVDWFGRNTLVVKGVPALVGEVDPARLMHQLLEEMETLDEFAASDPAEDTLARVRQRIAISLACRAAIKINTPLGPEKMQWMLDRLFRSENPYTCPHGRPIILRMNIEEILRGFKRI
ncbi:MAG TPA: DNA mismatch repair endonuclease MutL [Acidobacteriota bacterium]|nr:DNA mismatch repair endonuclease MutL [Acidobacteriota bacterium]